jgi:hypothetical protein
VWRPDGLERDQVLFAGTVDGETVRVVSVHR